VIAFDVTAATGQVIIMIGAEKGSTSLVATE
jgi:hypothetical protein